MKGQSYSMDGEKKDSELPGYDFALADFLASAARELAPD